MNDEYDNSITDAEMSEPPVTLFPEEIATTLVDLEAKIDYIVGVANNLNIFLAAIEPMMALILKPSSAGGFDPLSLMKLAASQ